MQVPYGADQWPPGCIDYAFNLIRPAAPVTIGAAALATSIRGTIFWTLVGRTLVFATLAQAEAYREMVYKLGGSCSDILTMDGHKIRSTGVICGSNFAPVQLAVASYRFAQLPAAKVCQSVLGLQQSSNVACCPAQLQHAFLHTLVSPGVICAGNNVADSALAMLTAANLDGNWVQDPLNAARAAEADALAALRAAQEQEARCAQAAADAADTLAAHEHDTAPEMERLQAAVGAPPLLRCSLLCSHTSCPQLCCHCVGAVVAHALCWSDLFALK